MWTVFWLVLGRYIPLVINVLSLTSRTLPFRNLGPQSCAVRCACGHHRTSTLARTDLLSLLQLQSDSLVLPMAQKNAELRRVYTFLSLQEQSEHD